MTKEGSAKIVNLITIGARGWLHDIIVNMYYLLLYLYTSHWLLLWGSWYPNMSLSDKVSVESDTQENLKALGPFVKTYSDLLYRCRTFITYKKTQPLHNMIQIGFIIIIRNCIMSRVIRKRQMLKWLYLHVVEPKSKFSSVVTTNYDPGEKGPGIMHVP